jgi:alpha-ribazole phosphatase
VIFDPKLRETNFGKLQGLPHGSNSSDIDYLANLDAKFPHGESNREMITRVIDAVNDIYKKNPNNTVLIVSHSGPLSVIFASIKNQHLRETMDDKAGFASIMTFSVEKPLAYPN